MAIDGDDMERSAALERQVADLVARLERSQDQTAHALANTEAAIAAAKEALEQAQHFRRLYEDAKGRLIPEDAKQIALLRAALQEWHHGQLPAMTALWAMYFLMFPGTPTNDEMEWAQRVIAERAKENERVPQPQEGK